MGGAGVRSGRRACTDLVRWYPPEWRVRYGDELVALIEDELEGARPSVAFRASVASAGLHERVRALRRAGRQGTPEVRIRSGALIVLGAWVALVFGGAAFAKAAEHFSHAQPAAAQSLSRSAYLAVALLAVAGAALVVLGASVALPATVRFLAGGGWPSVRRRLLVPLAWSAVTAVATIGLARWAHHLDLRQRNGADLAYCAAFLGCALFLAVLLGLWAAAAVAVGRRIDLTPRLIRVEGVLAVLLSAVMGMVTVAVGLWWVAMAHGAPWFLAGTRPGTRPSPVTVQLVLIEGLLAVATAVAGRGSWRAVTGLRRA
jgi:uncharacterized membrane protein YidH (DUF202 family)